MIFVLVYDGNWVLIEITLLVPMEIRIQNLLTHNIDEDFRNILGLSPNAPSIIVVHLKPSFHPLN